MCQWPGTGVSDADKKRQEQVIKEVETPMIPDLLAGENDFAGERGYVPYLQALEPYVDSYRPINKQLAADWKENRTSLLLLRDLAEKHLWPQLHGEWLPRLVDEGPKFAEEFTKLINNARLLSPFAKLLNLPTDQVIALAGGIGSVGGLSFGAILSAIADVSSLGWSAAGAGVSSFATYIAVEKAKEKYGQLALFFQRARRIAR